MLHLAIMKERPDVKSVVHCHPPHATAFGVAREPVPQCVLPEVEIFLGDVPITKYAIPGGKEFADTILPFVRKSNVIILANHGTVSYGETVERAYWWTEVLDAYCRILMLAKGLGRVNYFTEPEAQGLLDLKGKWGMQDPRTEIKNCDICANDVFRESWKDDRRGADGLRPAEFQEQRFEQRQCRRGQGHGRPGGPDPGHYRPRAGRVEQAEVSLLLGHRTAIIGTMTSWTNSASVVRVVVSAERGWTGRSLPVSMASYISSIKSAAFSLTALSSRTCRISCGSHLT